MRRLANHIRNHSNWLQYLWAKNIAGFGGQFLFRTKSGMKIEVPKRMLQTYKECFFDETYHKGFPDGIKNKIPEVVVDIGANVGYFSLFILHKYPK